MEEAVVSPAAVGRRHLGVDGPQMLAFLGEDEHTAGSGGKDVACLVDLEAIGKSGPLPHPLRGVEKDLALPQGSILVDGKGHQPLFDRAVSADDSVTGDLLVLHSEVDATVLNESVDFEEGTGIEEQVDAFMRRELACFVLALDALFTAACPRALQTIVELVEFGLVGGHGAKASVVAVRLVA